jgi:hypothetical protein
MSQKVGEKKIFFFSLISIKTSEIEKTAGASPRPTKRFLYVGADIIRPPYQ